MKRISMRSWAIWVLVLLLMGGIALFVAEFLVKAESWALSGGNPHVYAQGGVTPAKGTVLDCQGELLMRFGAGGQYHMDPSVRKATIHWLGDRQGFIYAPMLGSYAQYMIRYDSVNGLYDYAGQGGTVALTLSARVQKVALEAMAGHKGTIAVYNYHTGQILCAVTTPSYDPDAVPDIQNDTTGVYDGVYLNRFTQSVFIPGSIFKVVTTAAALEQLEDIAGFRYTCTGKYRFGVDQVTCVEPHGTLDLKEAMLKSCNCAYASLALKLGAQRLQGYVDRCGVLDSLYLDGITTAQGNIHLSDYADVELAWSAIGQHDDQVNPCSFMAFMGAVANGGQAAKPYMVESVRLDGHITYAASPQTMERVMSAKTSAILREYLRNNVESYYGDSNFPGLTVCAKSGTAEVGGNGIPNAMFTGFTLDEEYPLAFIVAIENGGYGQTTCMPILGPVLQACKNVLDNQ